MVKKEKNKKEKRLIDSIGIAEVIGKVEKLLREEGLDMHEIRYLLQEMLYAVNVFMKDSESKALLKTKLHILGELSKKKDL